MLWDDTTVSVAIADVDRVHHFLRGMKMTMPEGRDRVWVSGMVDDMEGLKALLDRGRMRQADKEKVV